MSTNHLLIGTTFRRILIVRLRSIGDTVLITPCLTILKQAFPGVEIDVLLDRSAAPVLRGHPCVSNVIEVPKIPGRKAATALARLGCIRQLYGQRYDLAINLHGGPTSMILTWLSRARFTVGFEAHPASWLMKLRSPSPANIWGRDNLHSVENQISVLRWLGLPIPTSLPRTTLETPPDSYQAIRSRLARLGWEKRYAVLHPVAASEQKEWLPERFAAVGSYLFERHNLGTIVIGTSAQKEQIERVIAGMSTPVLSILDAPLSEVMALISHSAIFVGNDSGPAHIAAAFRVPLVVIFGIHSFMPNWYPWTDSPNRAVRTESLREELCPPDRCPACRFPDCTRQITVAQVLQAVDEVLQEAELLSPGAAKLAGN